MQPPVPLSATRQRSIILGNVPHEPTQSGSDNCRASGGRLRLGIRPGKVRGREALPRPGWSSRPWTLDDRPLDGDAWPPGPWRQQDLLLGDPVSLRQYRESGPGVPSADARRLGHSIPVIISWLSLGKGACRTPVVPDPSLFDTIRLPAPLRERRASPIREIDCTIDGTITYERPYPTSSPSRRRGRPWWVIASASSPKTPRWKRPGRPPSTAF